MLSFGLDAGFESFPPLVNGLIHNRLFQVSPDLNKSLLQFSQITNRFLVHALLHAAPEALKPKTLTAVCMARVRHWHTRMLVYYG